MQGDGAESAEEGEEEEAAPAVVGAWGYTVNDLSAKGKIPTDVKKANVDKKEKDLLKRNAKAKTAAAWRGLGKWRGTTYAKQQNEDIDK